jgi:hypothetical protein
VLLEDAGEADDPRLCLDDTVGAPVDELARGVSSPKDRAASRAGRATTAA